MTPGVRRRRACPTSDRLGAAGRRHDPVVPRRPRRPVEPRRGGHGPRRRRPPRRGRAGLPLAGADASGPTAPGTSTTWPAGWRRPRSTPTSPPTWPPACGTTTSPPATPASCEDVAGRRARPWASSSASRRPRGEIIWARHADGTPWSFALLTASSSTCHSLRCALAVAARAGPRAPATGSVGRPAPGHGRSPTGPSAFLPKDRWAMDWYYPVLAGAVTGDVGRGPAGRRLGPLRHGRAWACAAWPTRTGSPRPRPASAPLAHLAAGETARARAAVRWAAGHLRARGRRLLHRHGPPSAPTTSRPASARPTARPPPSWPPPPSAAMARHGRCSPWRGTTWPPPLSAGRDREGCWPRDDAKMRLWVVASPDRATR